MDLLQDLLSQIATSITPGRGANLQGFEIDACVAFNKSSVVDSARARGTSDPEELIRVRVNFSERLATVQEGTDALLRGFDEVAYTHFRAATTVRFREAIRLRFVTVLTSQSYFVSGTVLGMGRSYAALTATGGNAFPPLPGGVPDWAV